mmetsp:Transcript_35156/g.100982  ORF Transcript_35156/g.100982 Transcript_35156/m.100982 type:complete len:410 (+) Transcript_35156:260-1489(+)
MAKRRQTLSKQVGCRQRHGLVDPLRPTEPQKPPASTQQECHHLSSRCPYRSRQNQCSRLCRSHPCRGRPWHSHPCRSHPCRSRTCRSRPCQSRLCHNRLCRSRLCRSRPCRSRPCQSHPCRNRIYLPLCQIRRHTCRSHHRLCRSRRNRRSRHHLCRNHPWHRSWNRLCRNHRRPPFHLPCPNRLLWRRCPNCLPCRPPCRPSNHCHDSGHRSCCRPDRGRSHPRLGLGRSGCGRSRHLRPRDRLHHGRHQSDHPCRGHRSCGRPGRDRPGHAQHRCRVGHRDLRGGRRLSGHQLSGHRFCGRPCGPGCGPGRQFLGRGPGHPGHRRGPPPGRRRGHHAHRHRAGRRLPPRPNPCGGAAEEETAMPFFQGAGPPRRRACRPSTSQAWHRWGAPCWVAPCREHPHHRRPA